MKGDWCEARLCLHNLRGRCAVDECRYEVGARILLGENDPMEDVEDFRERLMQFLAVERDEHKTLDEAIAYVLLKEGTAYYFRSILHRRAHSG